MSVSFVADKRPQPEPERIQATSQSPHVQTMEHFVKPWLRRKTYWDRSLNGVVKHDDSLRLLLALTPASEGYYILLGVQ